MGLNVNVPAKVSPLTFGWDSVGPFSPSVVCFHRCGPIASFALRCESHDHDRKKKIWVTLTSFWLSTKKWMRIVIGNQIEFLNQTKTKSTKTIFYFYFLWVHDFHFHYFWQNLILPDKNKIKECSINRKILGGNSKASHHTPIPNRKLR